jgi:YHS domain-containing protein
MQVKTKLFLSMVLSMALVVTNAQDANSVRKKQFNLDGGVAISGYDPVAYFTQGKAIKGKKDLAVSAEGVTYYFSTMENKEEFKKNYSKYEPQYGGWCAYAMGNDGSKVEVDPETFKIIDGKLFLFYNKFFNNTLKSWNKNEAGLKTKADANWQKIYH